MRFYLDEMFPPALAEVLRARGVEIISALEIGHVTMSDPAHLMFAAGEGRCVVTKNYDDFHDHTLEFLEQGLPHAGVLMVSKSLPSNNIGALVRALERFAHEHPDGLEPYTVVWLSPAPA